MDNSIQSATRPVILVVDSDPLTMTGIAAALHLAGYESHCARDGVAARKAAGELSLDLVICDVKVEGESGAEICRSIHQCDGNSDVPIMFVAANQSPDIIRRNESGSGVYYLRKPFDPKVMLELVERALWMPHLVNAQLNHREDGVNQIRQPRMIEHLSRTKG